MKRVVFALLCGLGVASMLLGGAASAKTFKLGTVYADDHPSTKAAVLFKKLVEEATRGNIEVKVFPNSQLGAIKDMYSQMQLGALELQLSGINTYAWIKGGEAFEISSIPFLYKSYEHMRCVLTSELFKPLTAEAEKETGIKLLNINGDTPPRGLTTKDRPVWSAADFKGLKIRTAAAPTVLAAMQKLGALPQQIAFGDLYMGLRTGVVDAQENGSITVKTSSFYEVQGYYMKTDYIRDIITFLVAMKTWNELSDQEKKILYEASEKAGNYATELVKNEIDSSIDFLATKMKVIIPDNQSIRKALEGVYEPLFEGTKWPKGLLQKVRDMKECG